MLGDDDPRRPDTRHHCAAARAPVRTGYRVLRPASPPSSLRNGCSGVDDTHQHTVAVNDEGHAVGADRNAFMKALVRSSTSAASTPNSVPAGLTTGWAAVVTSAPDANDTRHRRPVGRCDAALASWYPRDCGRLYTRDSVSMSRCGHPARGPSGDGARHRPAVTRAHGGLAARAWPPAIDAHETAVLTAEVEIPVVRVSAVSSNSLRLPSSSMNMSSDAFWLASVLGRSNAA